MQSPIPTSTVALWCEKMSGWPFSWHAWNHALLNCQCCIKFYGCGYNWRKYSS